MVSFLVRAVNSGKLRGGRKTEAEQRHSQLGQEINGLKLKVANLEEERKTEVEQLQAAEAKAAEAEAKAAELHKSRNLSAFYLLSSRPYSWTAPLLPSLQ